MAKSLRQQSLRRYDISPKTGVYMQPDLFDETLEKKILRMEKWIMRLQKDLYFLKEVYHLKQAVRPSSPQKKTEQLQMFAS